MSMPRPKMTDLFSIVGDAAAKVMGTATAIGGKSLGNAT